MGKSFVHSISESVFQSFDHLINKKKVRKKIFPPHKNTLFVSRFWQEFSWRARNYSWGRVSEGWQNVMSQVYCCLKYGASQIMHKWVGKFTLWGALWHYFLSESVSRSQCKSVNNTKILARATEKRNYLIMMMKVHFVVGNLILTL